MWDCGSEYIDSNKYLINKLQSLIVKCKFYPDGCAITERLDEVATHESKCPFKSLPKREVEKDPIFGPNKATSSIRQPKLVPTTDINDLPEKVSPFAEMLYFMTWENGCNRRLFTKNEYEEHKCVDHLKTIITRQHSDHNWYLNNWTGNHSSEKDVAEVKMQYERCKKSQEAIIQDLKDRLMVLEKRNEKLREARGTRKVMSNLEKKMHNDSASNKTDFPLVFMNFIQTAEDNFALFFHRMNKDFSKYKDNLKDELATYKLKTRANLMAKDTGGLKVSCNEF